jgi:GAF domain-containing protein
MEVAFVGGLTKDTFTFHRSHGEWPGVSRGTSVERTDSFCHRMVDGMPQATNDAREEPAYRDAPVRTELGIRSYVGVPIVDVTGAVEHGCVR